MGFRVPRLSAIRHYPGCQPPIGKRPRRTEYVGTDLHRRRSLAVCVDEEGERLWWRRFEN